MSLNVTEIIRNSSLHAAGMQATAQCNTQMHNVSSVSSPFNFSMSQ